MGLLNNENLFLLEFLVEDVQLDQGKCDCMHQKAGELCVGFQFLDNTELEVCERDFSPDKRFTQGNNDSRTGKSCLFSLTPTQAKAALESFDLKVHICRKTEPEKTVLGTVSISILEMLEELVHGNQESPIAKVLQDTFKLKDTNSKSIGKISVYIRLSCYGKMIITQFQMNLDDKSVIFQDKDGHSLYQYKKSKKTKENKIEDITQIGQNCNPSCHAKKVVDTNSPRFAAPNLNCPSQPCFPNSNGLPSDHIGSPYLPTLPSALDASYGASPSTFVAIPSTICEAWSSSSPNNMSPFNRLPPAYSFPQSNPNCPAQPCFTQSPGFDKNSLPMAPHKPKAKPKTKQNKSESLQPDVDLFYSPWMGCQIGVMPAADCASSPFENSSSLWGRPRQPMQTTRFSVDLGAPYDIGTKSGGCKGGCGR